MPTSVMICVFLVSVILKWCFVKVNYYIRFCNYCVFEKPVNNAVFKVLCVGIGIVLLTLAITLILPFAQENGLPIPDEYGEVIKVFAILIICLIASLKYITEALDKFKKILNGTKDQPVLTQEETAPEEEYIVEGATDGEVMEFAPQDPTEEQNNQINFEDQIGMCEYMQRKLRGEV